MTQINTHTLGHASRSTSAYMLRGLVWIWHVACGMWRVDRPVTVTTRLVANILCPILRGGSLYKTYTSLPPAEHCFKGFCAIGAKPSEPSPTGGGTPFKWLMLSVCSCLHRRSSQYPVRKWEAHISFTASALLRAFYMKKKRTKMEREYVHQNGRRRSALQLPHCFVHSIWKIQCSEKRRMGEL